MPDRTLPLIVIGLMVVVTQVFRFGGYLLMRHVKMTPRLEAALRALPGTVAVSTVVPMVLTTGLPALAGVVITVVTMVLSRKDFLALTLGLAAVIIIRGWH